MKFIGHYTGIGFDLSDYKRQLQDYLVETLHKGTKAWLKVVAGRGGRVPLWSGMARASLLEVSQLVDGTVVLSPLKVPSRISQGRTLGKATQRILESKVDITIETSVPHYTLQEYQRAKQGGSPRAPWKSLEAGIIAFRLATKDATLPKPMFKPLIMEV
jgi:hypothetical protein